MLDRIAVQAVDYHEVVPGSVHLGERERARGAHGLASSSHSSSACAVGLAASCHAGMKVLGIPSLTDYPGGQAEYVVVPCADSCLLPIPEPVSCEAALLLTDNLSTGWQAALRAGNKLELSALRMAIAAIKKQEIEQRSELSDDAVIAVIGKMIKQGRDARDQFESAGREELAAKEAAEIVVFERYMPKALTEAEVEALIQRAIETTGASSIKDMGRVMGVIKGEAAGRADLGAISSRVREVLGAG